MAIYQLGKHAPAIASSAYIVESASVIGRVRVGERSSIWFGAIVRGDDEEIVIGEGSNVQESCVLHADAGFPLLIGNHVTVGHQAMLHGCIIGDSALIGIQAVILNGAKIGRNCLVGAGALVTEGKEFADNSLIIGSPAKVIRTLSEEDIARMQSAAAHYVRRNQQYRSELKRIA